jgi:hypothetical protein
MDMGTFASRDPCAFIASSTPVSFGKKTSLFLKKHKPKSQVRDVATGLPKWI